MSKLLIATALFRMEIKSGFRLPSWCWSRRREPSVELLLVEVEVEVELAEEVLLPALPVPRPEQVPSTFDGMVGLFGCRVNELEESSVGVGGKELLYAAKISRT